MSERKINYEEEVKKCKTMEDVMGKNGLVKRLIKDMIENMLQAELEATLGYKKHEIKGRYSGNSRNGHYDKTVRSSIGEIDLEVPRDRNGEFEPHVVKKHKKDINEFDEKIISMYGKGMTTRDIQNHVKDMYGAEISPAMVSMITDKVETLVIEWQNRPLQAVYPIVYFDAIHYKVRDNGKVINKASYTCFGIDIEGRKDILGMWIGEHEGARHWLTVLNELKSRGAKDVLIACVDGLKGLPEALETVFPQVNVQLCVVHMIRNSLKYVGSKNQKAFLVDLKKVYQAASEPAAKMALDDLYEKWGEIYPLAVNPWINRWDQASHYFQYPPELRRMIYTTNAVEALHRQFRKVTKNRAVMPNDDALLKLLFLAGRDIQKKWTMPVSNWSLIITQLHIIFKERIMAQ
jgi:transposase-like protein